MQTLTDSKTRTLNKKSEITELLAKARSVLREFNPLEIYFLSLRQFLMLKGFTLGGILIELKEQVGHGNWENWLPSNLPELGDAEQTRLNNAKRMMKLWNDNQSAEILRLRSKSTGIPVDLKKLPTVPNGLAFECNSERKFMWRYVREKERPENGQNHKFPRSISFLNIVNEYNRVKHRHVNALQLVDFEEAREETTELLQFLKWLHGETTISPWQS